MLGISTTNRRVISVSDRFSKLAIIILLLTPTTNVVAKQQHVQTFACIPIKACVTYVKLIQTIPLTNDTRQMLRSAQCGSGPNGPKVLCPIITEEDQSQGQAQGHNHNQTHTVQTPMTINMTAKSFVLSRADSSEPVLPSKDNCGASALNRIYNGNATDLDEYPWTAMLLYGNKNNKELSSLCGGTLISKRYVVTAAHCVTPRLQFVVLGEYDTRNATDCVRFFDGTESCALPPQMIKIEKVLKYPRETNERVYYNDIALLRLENEVKFNDFVAPICLPSKDDKDLKVGSRVIAVGWGKTHLGFNSPVKLQVSVKVKSRIECKAAQRLEITNRMICAGGDEQKDACFGDSGGPLNYFDLVKQYWTLVGIVSFSGPPCGTVGVPAVYTWLPPYVEWIQQNVY